MLRIPIINMITFTNFHSINIAPCSWPDKCDPNGLKWNCFQNWTPSQEDAEEVCCRMGCCWNSDSTSDWREACYKNMSKKHS